jgi:hypothetical protein
MRGATDPNETLGAQELKSEYGSVRIRDKQQELARVARDCVRITTEIITDKFNPVTMIEMSQTTLPTQKMIQQQVGIITQQMQQAQQQVAQAAQSPQGQQIAQQNPQQAQQLMGQVQQQMSQAQQQIQELQEHPTIEQVLSFIKNARAKAFTLDIETDSTIHPNEDAEKQRRTEFIQVLGTLLPQLSQMISAQPMTATFCGELLKFATAPYRAGRPLEGSIDQLVTMLEGQAKQPRPDDPATAQNKAAVQIEQMKDQRQRDKDRQDYQLAQQELQQKDRHKQAELVNQRYIEQMRLSAKGGDLQAKAQLNQQKMVENAQDHQASMAEKSMDLKIDAQKADIAVQDAAARRQEMQQRSIERRQEREFRMMQPRTSGMRPPGGL